MRCVARRSVAAFVAAVLVVVLAPFVAAPAHATAADDTSALYAATNADRAANGLPPLQWDPLTALIAQSWVAHLVAINALVHNPDLATEITTTVTSSWTRIGENIGWAGTVSSLESAYMASSGHRANILGDYNRVGIATMRDGSGNVWSVVDFVNGPSLASPVPVDLGPFPTPEALVNQQYLDLLSRPADPSGLAYWSSLVSQGAVTAPQMISGFMLSNEFGQMVAPVARLYTAALKRTADYSGLTYWINAERGGLPLAAIATYIASSAEFQNLYGSLDPVAFIWALYANVLNRAPDAQGLTYWLAMLTQGVLGRGTALMSFSESAEYQQRTFGMIDATLGYIGMLRRSPDPGGLSYWGSQLQVGMPLPTFVGALLHSTEYAARF